MAFSSTPTKHFGAVVFETRALIVGGASFALAAAATVVAFWACDYWIRSLLRSVDVP